MKCLHLLTHGNHEVALVYHVTDAKAGENERITEFVDQAKNNLPPERNQTLAYEQAADTATCMTPRDLFRGRIKPISSTKTAHVNVGALLTRQVAVSVVALNPVVPPTPVWSRLIV